MKYIHFLLGATLLAAGSSCQESGTDELRQQTLTAPVAFTSEIVSMSAEPDSWSDGDQIGVYMFAHGTNRIVGAASNAQYKASASGSLTPAGTAAHYSSDFPCFDFCAYFPYRADAASYIVPLDLRDQSLRTATMLLYSNNAAAIPEQGEAVTLRFTHKLAKLAFNITPGSGLTAADLVGLTMSVDGLDAQADFNSRQGSIEHPHNPLDIAALTAADGKTAQFVTLPGQNLRFKLHFTLRNQLTFDWETDKTFSIAEGKILTLNVTIGNSAVEVTPGGISDWTGIDTPPTTGEGEEVAPPKSYAVGDFYPDADAPVGIVFEISDGGKHGKVVGLVEYKNRWGAYPKEEATDGVPEAANVDDGHMATLNMVTVRHTAGNFASDYNIFNWLYTTVNGNRIDGEWFFPAKNEIRALLAGISGLKYTDIADAWTDTTPMPNLAATAGARTAFNAKFTTAGGTALNLYGTYWSSTEIDKDYAWCVKFDTGMVISNKFKYDVWPAARPITTF